MKKEISSYYDYTLPFYRFFWHKNQESHALHYGFWEKGTNNLEEALLNTNKFLAKIANLQREESVLDAGCGVGGSSIWLAKNLGVSATGISISKKQILEAKKLAQENKVSNLASFYVMDFLKTKFADSSFDVVWSIESACHAKNKKDFLKEAYRILKKGGRLVVADGFLKRAPNSDHEKEILDKFNSGLVVPGLPPYTDFEAMMRQLGFKNIKVWDKTKQALPSSRKLYNMCKFAYPISKITEKLHLTSPILTKNNLAGIVQYQAFEKNLGGYFVFYGEK